MLRITSIQSYEGTAIHQAIRPVIAEALGSIDKTVKNINPTVVVKPNWIQESHEYKPDVWEPVITHPTVILAVIECVAELLAGRVSIWLCDAPHTYANFEAILARGNLKQPLADICNRWPSLTLETLDLRREVWLRKEEVVVERRPNQHDPRGYVRLDLSRNSLFYDHPGQGRFYGADYDTETVNSHHTGEVHEYLLAGSAVKCDLFINLPKLKTHKKTGLTCCLKNLVGINGDKNWLPHHTFGTPDSGGDEFPSQSLTHWGESLVKRAGQKMALALPGIGSWAYRKARNVGKQVLGDSETEVRNGNWSGNDTCWRMALDLNRALLYGNSDGTWREKGEKKPYVAIVDGILGGEGNGPLCPSPVSSGILLTGTNPAQLDAVAAQLMGFDPREIPIVKQAFASHRWPISAVSLEDIRVSDERLGRIVKLDEVRPAVPGGFRPHFGWMLLRNKAGVCEH